MIALDTSFTPSGAVVYYAPRLFKFVRDTRLHLLTPDTVIQSIGTASLPKPLEIICEALYVENNGPDALQLIGSALWISWALRTRTDICLLNVDQYQSRKEHYLSYLIGVCWNKRKLVPELNSNWVPNLVLPSRPMLHTLDL